MGAECDLLGLLLIADQVRYIVYSEMREDCSRPELGWASCSDMQKSTRNMNLSNIWLLYQN